MSSKEAFKLSVQLEGHSADVRSVVALESASPSDPILLSGSRDGTARVWGRSQGSKSKRDLTCRHILEGQAGFVNSCAWAEVDGQALALAGGQDHLVNAYIVPPSATAGPSTSPLSPEFTLVGHSDNVCALDVWPEKNGYIVSGSWDKTAKVWRNFECVATLAGHEQAVWAVLALDHDHVLTASADKIVRLYSISKAASQGEKSKPIATFTGSSDAVRGLVRINERLFASCGNDGNIYVYPLGDPASMDSATPVTPVQTLSGHTSFVYSLASLGRDELASAGEDRSVRIWKGGQLQQTITIPAISVWSVTAMPSGDIACASSDGFVRVFTRSPQKFADTDILQAYDAAVSSQSLNKAQVGDVQKENLPGLEALAQPGREGQVKMIRVGEMVEAHQYNSATSSWDKIGEVVGGVGSSQKKLHEGKEYDYVFDVDIAEGVPPLKLPYNASENPYVTAQRFLEKNELPLTYLDQVVGFIEKNTGAVSIGGSGEFVDPYTGASSYRPGAPSDPPPSLQSNTVGPTPAAATPLPTSTILPVTQTLTFKQFNELGAKAKIEELNAKLVGASALSSQDKVEINALLSELTGLAAGGAQPLTPSRLQVLKDAMLRWPLSERFPLLDVYRIACLSSSVGTLDGVGTALLAAAWSDESPASKAKSTAILLGLRASANALTRASPNDMLSILAEVTSGTSNVNLSTLNKQARTAYATVLFNLSVAIATSAQRVPSASQLLNIVAGALALEAQVSASERDGEAAYRGAIALGNLCTSPSFGSLSASGFQKALQSAQMCANNLPETRLDTLLREIESRSSLS